MSLIDEVQDNLNPSTADEIIQVLLDAIPPETYAPLSRKWLQERVLIYREDIDKWLRKRGNREMLIRLLKRYR